MPKSRSFRTRTGSRPLLRSRERIVPWERRQVAEPAVERVDLFADEANNDGKGPVPKNSQTVVDFEAFLKESGLLDIQQGCGEVDNSL